MFRVSDVGHRDVETPSSNNGQDSIGMIDLVIWIKLRKTATLKLRENCFFLIQVQWTRSILTQDQKQAFHQIMVITRTTTVSLSLSLSLFFFSSVEIYFNLKIKHIFSDTELPRKRNYPETEKGSSSRHSCIVADATTASSLHTYTPVVRFRYSH